MDVFPLLDEDGKLYSPIRQAATLAKYSRSPESARVLVEKTPELKAEKFQERVIVNWGHDSVAELATIPVCFEGVSIVASKVLEAWPRPGCSEKSTRMQQFTRDQMCWPDPSMESRFGSMVGDLFDLYEKVIPWAVRTNPTGVTGTSTDHRVVQTNIEKAAFDIARCILPAGVKTNLGLVAYPRDYAKMIRFLLGSSNAELIAIGGMLKSSLDKVGGPLIRHVEPQPWFSNFEIIDIPGHDLEFPPVGLPRAKLISSSGPPQMWEELIRLMYGVSLEEFSRVMDNRPFKTEVPDIFSLYRVGFDILIDYGAFRDIQRHRPPHKFVEDFSPKYGFVIPDPLLDSPFKDDFVRLMEDVAQHITDTDIDECYAQYVTPMCFLHRSFFEMDLRELYYLTELRTQPQGHISYRRIASQMAVAAQRVFPDQMHWCRYIHVDD